MKFLFPLIISIVVMEITKGISFTVDPLVAKTAPAKDILVSNIDELYREVNKQSNENNTIILAPNIYFLDVGKSPSTNGRLELQRGMQLKGESKVKNASNEWPALIDGSHLPKESFANTEADAPKKTGCIRIGKGRNDLSFLTVKGNSSSDALSAIDTDLDDAIPEIHIDHLIIKNSKTGIDIRNGGPRAKGRKLTASVENSEFLQNTIDAGIGAGQGITIQNSNQADGASIDIKLNNNFTHNNNIGIRVMNQNVSSATIQIESSGDRFESNQLSGVMIFGGMYLKAADNVPAITNNKIIYKATNIIVRDNGNFSIVKTQPSPCGIFIAGGYTTASDNSANNNSVDMQLTNTSFVNNKTANIVGFGAGSDAVFTSAGIQNKVTITSCPPLQNTKTIRLVPSSKMIKNESNSARLIKIVCGPRPNG